MPPKPQIAMTPKKPPVSAKELIERARGFWKALTPQRQIYLVLGAAVTVAVAVFLVRMITDPNYKPLMAGLEPADMHTIVSQLEAKKISYKLGADGTSISVPADKLDTARMEIASHDATNSGRIGFEIFDKVSWGQTEFDEKVNYQRALEGELERTIQSIGNVKSARVHVVMATDSVFSERERGAKASVALKLKHGSLSREELSAISRLVAGAVNNLKPADVTIIDAESNEMMGQGTNSNESNDAMERELTRRLMTTLSPVVGTDRVRASVNVEYENASSETSEEKYDPAVSAVLTMQHSEEITAPGALASGVPGTSSNVPSAKEKPQTGSGREMVQSSKSDNNTYGVNKTLRHKLEPAGGVRRLTAAIVLDDLIEHKQVNGKITDIRHKRDAEELKMISELAQAAIGFNSDRGDTISVQNLSFDRPAQMEIVPAGIAEQVRDGLNKNMKIVRYAVILLLFLLVYFTAIRPIQKRAFAPIPPSPAELEAKAKSEALETERALKLPPPPPDPSQELAKRSQELKKQVVEFVQKEPDTGTTAVRAWLREDMQ